MQNLLQAADITVTNPSSKPKDARAARLAEQLRANLQRRKAQARARREGAADERPEGIAAAPQETGGGNRKK